MPSGKCLLKKCGNKENFFTPVAGTLFCDVGESPTLVNEKACRLCEI